MTPPAGSAGVNHRASQPGVDGTPQAESAVYELLLALAASEGWTSEQIARRAEEKRAERGGFGGRVWLDSWE